MSQHHKTTVVARMPSNTDADTSEKLKHIEAMSDVTGVTKYIWQNEDSLRKKYAATNHNVKLSAAFNAKLEFAVKKQLIFSKRAFLAEVGEQAIDKLISQWERNKELLLKAQEIVAANKKGE